MPAPEEGCVKPSKGPINKPRTEKAETAEKREEEVTMMARVGREAPDFEASAFYQGNFKNITLSEFRGKWVVLCFYPGDFTFV